MTAALIAAIILGVALGFAMNLSQTAQGAIAPVLEFYRPISAARLSAAGDHLVRDRRVREVLVIFGILPSIIIATNEVYASQDRVNAARSLGASRAQVIFCAASARHAEHHDRDAHWAGHRLG